METQVNSNQKATCLLSITAAAALLIGGVWFWGYLLGKLPSAYGLGIGNLILWEAAALTPVVAGGAWLRHMYRRRDRNSWRRGTIGGVIFGSLLVITGLLLLAFNSGRVLPEWRPITVSWQTLLLIIGVISLWKKDVTSGLILISIGTFFIIPKIGRLFPEVLDIAPGFTATYWPILIAIAGAAFIIGLLFCRNGMNRHRCHMENRRCDMHNRQRIRYDQYEARKDSASNDGRINFNLIFSGSEHVFLDPVFMGGSISTVFGGMTLDLRRTSLPDGVTYLRVDAVFGGVEIKAPEDWNIEIESNAIFGGFKDSRRYYKDPKNDGRKLIIISNCTFGGGEIE